MTTWDSPLGDPLSQLTPHLRPHERLLWWGRPDPSVHFGPADAVLVPFSIVWAGFAIMWEAIAIAVDAPLFFKLWGLPFVALGLYLLVGRFVYKRRRKLRTAYGVTTERVLVAVGDRYVRDTPVKQTPTTVRRSRDGRHVSVAFGYDWAPVRWGRRGWSRRRGAVPNAGLDVVGSTQGPLGFYDVADVSGLLSALQRAGGAT